MKLAVLLFLAVPIGMASIAAAADPVVSNARASQRAGTKLVDITYDVTAANNLAVSVAISTNSRLTYDLPSASFSGTGYRAVAADYDGDGLADPAVRSATGDEWIVMLSSGGYTPVSLTISFE